MFVSAKPNLMIFCFLQCFFETQFPWGSLLPSVDPVLGSSWKHGTRLSGPNHWQSETWSGYRPRKGSKLDVTSSSLGLTRENVKHWACRDRTICRPLFRYLDKHLTGGLVHLPYLPFVAFFESRIFIDNCWWVSQGRGEYWITFFLSLAANTQLNHLTKWLLRTQSIA